MTKFCHCQLQGGKNYVGLDNLYAGLSCFPGRAQACGWTELQVRGVPTQAHAFAYPFTHNQTQTHTHTHTKTRTKATAVRIKPQLMFTFLTTAKEKFALPAENSTLPAKPRQLH